MTSTSATAATLTAYSPDLHWLIVTRPVATQTGLDQHTILKRICSASRKRNAQRPAPDYHYPADACSQPAVHVDDGNIEWTVTFTCRPDATRTKRVAFVVGARIHTPNS